MTETPQDRAPMWSLASYEQRTTVDVDYFEALLVTRRVLDKTTAELDAIETIGAAATALEHRHPTMDMALARKLRQSMNLVLSLARFNTELIQQINELDGTYSRADEAAARAEIDTLHTLGDSNG